MTGRVIAIVGPSGVGKDTVMVGLVTACPQLRMIRRVITRATDAGGEDFEGVSVAAFEQRLQQGAFVLHWQAHGLHYGIPTEISHQLADGHDVLVNLSRGVLHAANAAFDHLLVLSLSATADVLARRLAARGREDAGEIAKRLSHADKPLPPGLERVHLDNSGALADTIDAARRAIYPDKA